MNSDQAYDTRTLERGSSATTEFDLAIEGMTCAACIARVEKAIRNADGVQDVAVNLATHRARVKATEMVDPLQLVERVERAGYGARVVEHETPEKLELEGAQTVRRARVRFIVAAPFAAVVMIIAMSPMVVPAIEELWGRHSVLAAWLQLVLSSIVLFFSGRDFFTIAVRNARHLTADMNTLVAVGTGAAWLYSTVALLFGGALNVHPDHSLYFDTAAVVVALVLLGRWLEARARADTSSAIRRLMALAPRVAHRVDPDDPSSLVDVEVEYVHVGDVLLVRPGEAVPVDGVVVHGASAIDESTITGESMPVEKGPGAKVMSATINTDRVFRMRAEGVGEQTVLAAIVRAVRDAQSSKAPVQRLADRIAQVFVPAVIAIALMTFFLWLLVGDVGPTHAMINAVAVLVIACPCAMGLAVPTAVIAATGRGAEEGILIRSADALERAGSIAVVAFDKTGTLTLGRPEVVDVRPAHDWNIDDVMGLAASVEQLSEHPIARAITRMAEDRSLPMRSVEGFRSHAGIGAEGWVGGLHVSIGKPRDAGVDNEGQTTVVVHVDDLPAASIVLQDRLKPESEETVARIASLGIASAMVTGDNESTARSIATALGIDTVVSGVLPAEKAAAIHDLRRRFGTVAMVGDGVNDAPALASADVGMAMATGSDVALSAADVTIVGGRIDRVPRAILLARRSVRIIRENLFWAFIYNVIGIPLAAFGLLDPVIAGAAMALSSVSVVTNSLRLKRTVLSQCPVHS